MAPKAAAAEVGVEAISRGPGKELTTPLNVCGEKKNRMVVALLNYKFTSFSDT